MQIPESPRLLFQLGYEEDACEALERYAAWNGTSLPPGELVTEEEKARLVGQSPGHGISPLKKKVHNSLMSLQ